VEIRPLPVELQDAAVALWHVTGLTRPWNDPAADLDRALAGPSSTVLAAVDVSPAGALAGTVMVGHDGHRGWVYYLSVATRARRHGIGTSLVRASERWLVDRGIPKLQLMVRRDNTAATGFYTSLGYEVVDVTVLGRRLDGAVS
jgi:ribosomal protein S18 acetylase RimI-like enzyme